VLDFIGTEKTARWEAAVRESLWGAGASSARNGTSSQPVSSGSGAPASDVAWRMEYRSNAGFKMHPVTETNKLGNFRRQMLYMGD